MILTVNERAERLALGAALLAEGRNEDAVDVYDAILKVQAQDAVVRWRRAEALVGLKRWNEAIEDCLGVLAVQPDAEKACEIIAAVVKHLRVPDALSILKRGLDYRPESRRLRHTLGDALLKLERFDALIEVSREGLIHLPDDALLLEHLWQALSRRQRFDEAMEVLQRIVVLWPDKMSSHCNLGVGMQSAGRLEEAIDCFERAIALEPDRNALYVNRAVCELQLGRFETGWKTYERRIDRETFYSKTGFSRPAWDGRTPLAGKTVLVHAEFGLGDTLQFCRYIPMMEAAGARVLFAPQPVLSSLIRSLSPTIEIVRVDDPTLVYDLQCRAMSLPGAFGTRLETIPAAVPYLAAAPDRVAAWRERLGHRGLGDRGLTVGVCWRGSVVGDRRGLSFAAEELAPLARIPGVRLISLQKSGDPGEIARISANGDLGVLLDPSDMSEEAFGETAALARACDLVISCDTSVAHLAGALGCPTWVVMPVEGDWRWLTGRADSPWYPTMTLFRHSLLGGRAGVFEALEAELRMLVEARSGGGALPIPGEAQGRLVDVALHRQNQPGA